MSSEYSDYFTCSLPVWIPYTSFSYSIAVAKNFNTSLNKIDESEHFCLVPDLVGRISAFHC